VLLGAITNQPILCLLIAAVVTWAAHSSVAVVLVVMSLGAAQVISPTAVIAMVLGANVGSALNPLIEASDPGNPGQPAAADRQSADPSSAARSCCRSCP
jgi:phosphate:Na+ symporter